MSELKIWPGLGNGNEVLVCLAEDSMIDDATSQITLPEKFRGGGWSPLILGSVTAGAAGAQGARTLTNQSSVQELSCTFVESTGVLTVTNAVGGTLTRVLIFVLMVGAQKAF